LWREIPHSALVGTIADVWTEEQPALMLLPQAFDGLIVKSKRVSPTHCPAGDACTVERGFD
jgi:hypothetical protein